MREINIKIARGEMKTIKRGVAEESQQLLMKEAGDSALILYEFYVKNSYRDDYTFPDEDAVKHLGWPLAKVIRTRRKLVKHRWLYQESGKYSGGRKIFTTYLGKKKVLAALGIRELTPLEEMSIGSRVKKELNLADEEVKTSKEAKKLARQYVDELEHTHGKKTPAQKAIEDEYAELEAV